MGAAPRSVQHAVRLMYVGAGLSALNTWTVLQMRGHIRAAIESRSRTHPKDHLTPAQIDAAATTTITVLVVSAAIGALLWLLMAVFNRQGRWWARIASTVLALLCLLQTWSFLTRGHPTTWAALLAVAIAAVAAASTLLLWQRENSAHFGQSLPDAEAATD